MKGRGPLLICCNFGRWLLNEGEGPETCLYTNECGVEVSENVRKAFLVVNLSTTGSDLGGWSDAAWTLRVKLVKPSSDSDAEERAKMRRSLPSCIFSFCAFTIP